MSSLRQRWVFPAITLALPLLCLLLAEGILRLFGYGYDPAFLVYEEGGDTARTNPEFGRRFFPASLSRAPVNFRLSPTAPEDTIRIFVLGGSAAQGVPNPDYGMVRQLEALLRLRHPDVEFEVFNAAMTAINSHVLVEIADDLRAFDPDLFVVYVGNNEIVGPYGPGTVLTRANMPRWMIRASVNLRAWRLGQLLENMISGPGETTGSWRGMEMFLDQTRGPDDPGVVAAREHFASNLEAIISLARTAGAEVVLSTVATNLADCPPFASAGQNEISQSVESALVEAGDALVFGELERSRRMLSTVPDSARQLAEVQFFHGELADAGGDVDAAREFWIQARDADQLRFRCDSLLNHQIRHTARGHVGVALADPALVLGDAVDAVNPVPGSEQFFEHVHLTFAGNYAVAVELMRAVESALSTSGAISGSDAVPDVVPTIDDVADWLGFNPASRLQQINSILDMTARPPFTSQWNHYGRRVQLEKGAAEAEAELRTSGWEPILARHEKLLEARPGDAILKRRFLLLQLEAGRYAAARNTWNELAELMPVDDDLMWIRGRLEFHDGHPREAVDWLSQIVERNPFFIQAYLDLFHPQNAVEPGSGEATLREAIRRSGGDTGLSLAFADYLKANQRITEAVDQWKTAASNDPGAGPARDALLSHHLSRGEGDAALSLARDWSTRFPDFPEVQYDLGRLSSHLQLKEEATDAFHVVLKLNPYHVNARLRLAALLQSSADDAAALSSLRDGLRLRPRHPLLLNDLAWTLLETTHDELRDPQEALALASVAVEESEAAIPEILETHASAAAALGQYSLAVQSVSRAHELFVMRGDQASADRTQASEKAYRAAAQDRDGSG